MSKILEQYEAICGCAAAAGNADATTSFGNGGSTSFSPFERQPTTDTAAGPSNDALIWGIAIFILVVILIYVIYRIAKQRRAERLRAEGYGIVTKL